MTKGRDPAQRALERSLVRFDRVGVRFVSDEGVEAIHDFEQSRQGTRVPERCQGRTRFDSHIQMVARERLGEQRSIFGLNECADGFEADVGIVVMPGSDLSVLVEDPTGDWFYYNIFDDGGLVGEGWADRDIDWDLCTSNAG